jgi:hypothetical protein
MTHTAGQFRKRRKIGEPLGARVAECGRLDTAQSGPPSPWGAEETLTPPRTIIFACACNVEYLQPNEVYQ